MIRALFPLLLLAACAEFPQVDAAAPKTIPPRPAFLSGGEVAAVNALALDIPASKTLPDERELRARAKD